MGSETDRRQTIGRGLRLAVNQQGERVRGAAVNTLTVVATESFEQFAERLQHELSEAGTRFGTLENHVFAGVELHHPGDVITPLGYEGSRALWDFFHDKGYVSASGHVQAPLRTALQKGALDLPPQLQGEAAQIEDILRRATGAIEIKNADDRRPVRPREAVLDSPEFKALWERVKHKTTYRVHFDNEALLRRCRQALADAPSISSTRLHWTLAGIKIQESGVSASDITSEAAVPLQETDIELPDLLTELQNRTQLTRRSIARILTESGRLDGFLRNPAEFIRIAAEAINRTKRVFIVDGIKYQRLGDEAFYAQELFRSEELIGYLRRMVPAQRGVYEDVIYQSEVEARFAEQLEKNDAVKVYAKLPGWFKVPTPLGTYNPDWAVLIDRDGEERLYFVVETKGSAFAEDLRETETAKIKCGRAHFDALAAGQSNPARFRTVTDLAGLLGED